MSHVYQETEVVGSSADGIEAAIRLAIKRLAKSGERLDWFEVKEIRGWIEDGRPQFTQVVIQVGHLQECAEEPEIVDAKRGYALRERMTSI